MKATRPSHLTQDDLDEIAVFTLRTAEGLLTMLAESPPEPPESLPPEILRRRQSFIDRVAAAEKRVLEIKRAGRLAATVARLKAKDQYGDHPETGMLVPTPNQGNR